MQHDVRSRSARSLGSAPTSSGRDTPGPGKLTLTGALGSLAPARGGAGASPPPPAALPPQARRPAAASGAATPQALFGVRSRAAAPLQPGAGGAAIGAQNMQAIAAEGMRGPGRPLPHGDQIQAAFGRHDIRGVRAHTDEAATAANQQLGANGYASGGAVAFRGAPDLHLAAHEAAHVVQQRGGVQLSAVGAAGDRHERHADAVADRVVAGQSAEALLDPYAGGASSTSSGGHAVQRQLAETNRDGIYHDTRGHGYALEHVWGNYYRVLGAGAGGVYQYNAGTQQYVSDAGIHFDAATTHLLQPSPHDPRWLTRRDGTAGWYYYDYTTFQYVLYAPPPQPLFVQHGDPQDVGGSAMEPEQPENPRETTASSPEPRRWDHNGTYWESSDGYTYYASNQTLMKDGRRVPDPTILGEVQPLEEGRKQRARQTHAVRTIIPTTRARTIDEKIEEQYRVERAGREIRFFTLAGKKAGEISWYDKDGKLSFDVSKLEKFEGEHTGIGSMLIYWLTKHGNTGYREAQIEAFESQSGGTGRLQNWYMKHGFDAGMHGFVDEIRDASEVQVRSRLG